MSDLAAALFEAAAILKGTGQSVHGEIELSYQPTDLMLKDAESAASRVIQAVEAYRLGKALEEQK